MGPPPVPPAQNPVSPGSPRATSDNSGVGTGPGPLRHPRPLTPAELHLELEKEQEAVVNRLTRELSLLRQQTASVVSNASSTSTNIGDSVVPTSARRHRSSSNLSTRSINAVTAGATSISGVAPARESSVAGSTRPSMDVPRPTLSRESSVGPSRYSTHRQASQAASTADHIQHPRSPSFSAAVAAARYEEAAFHRAELDSVKRENEILRQRIRELERTLANRSGNEGSESRGRSSTSVSRS